MTPPDLPGRERSPGGWVGVFGRGLAMGVAEVIPGVSGGTIAFISGIYDELLGSIARFGPASVTMLLAVRSSADFGRLWQFHNLTFLCTLVAGMFVALLSVARIVSALLERMPPVVWGFFFGLIIASVALLARRLPARQLIPWGGLGLLVGLALASASALVYEPAPWMYIPGGMLAVTAWILPGISGSFILLLLGLYAGVLSAVDSLDFVVIGAMAAGCVLGLLLFARGLQWLLGRFYGAVLGVLTGIMAGSLPRLWPWRDAAEGLQWPSSYAGDPHLLLTLVLMVVGAAAIVLLERAGPAVRVERSDGA